MLRARGVERASRSILVIEMVAAKTKVKSRKIGWSIRSIGAIEMPIRQPAMTAKHRL